MELQLVNLTKEFGNFRAVNNLNLTISNGVYGLLGVNGAGKNHFNENDMLTADPYKWKDIM